MFSHVGDIAPKTTIEFYIDNESTILVASNHSPTKRRKFIYVRYHYLLEHV